MKAKFISKYAHKEFNEFIVELEYEYRGHRYTISENRSKGNEPLSWQHKNAQAEIDRLIELENRPKDDDEHESIDEIMAKWFYSTETGDLSVWEGEK